MPKAPKRSKLNIFGARSRRNAGTSVRGAAEDAGTLKHMCMVDAKCAETLEHIYMLGAEGAGTLGHMLISGSETCENASKVRLANDETPQAKLVSYIDVDG